MRNAVLTGDVRIGKTTVCRAVVQLVRDHGYCVQGILTPPILDQDGRRIGVEVVDIASGERRVLARCHQSLAPDSGRWTSLSPVVAPSREIGEVQGCFRGPTVGAYQFDAAALEWGQQAVSRAVGSGCDLLVIDEIGRLELERGDGFARVLPLLETSVLLRSLLVVREELLLRFRARLPHLEHRLFEVQAGNREVLAVEIVDWFHLR